MSSPRPPIAKTVPALRRAVAGFRTAGEQIALVPTMGALHEGHLSLVRQARKRADRVVVSIFVNPAQFAPHEDFATYPRTLVNDVRALADVGIDLVWAPTAAVMYPEGFSTRIEPAGPALAGLEDKFRPHFFGGVTTVVSKLFIQCQPDVAVFGEKDYQQLQVVTRMAADLDLPVKVVGIPTVRERDGLALSSRNAYLSETERTIAPTLHRVLTACAREMRSGTSIKSALKAATNQITKAGFQVDYLEARHAATLAPVASMDNGPVRLLVAARLGKTRLIDNIKA